MSKLFAVCKVQFALLILASLFLAAPSAFAEVPTSITQQGRLLTADGQPMQGSKTLLFELYNDATDGEVLWSDQFEVDLGNSGFYTAILGTSDNPLDHTVFQSGPTFMQLVIDDKPLLPRLELTSVPYAQIAQIAHQAKLAETAGHAETAGRADSVNPGSINTAAIVDKAVTADKIDSIPWSKVTGQPTIPTYTGSDFVTSNQSCTTAGQMVTGISASGTLVCATPTDNNTQYTAGSGLSLSGTSFSIRAGGVTDNNIVDMSWTKITGKPEITGFTSSNFVKSGAACTGTQFFMGFNADGTLRCSQPQDTTYTVQTGQGLSLTGNQFGVATSGIQTGHIADGSITAAKVAQGSIQAGHIANGAITADKIAAPITLYQVTATNCNTPVGAVSLDPHCVAIQPNTPCGICGSMTNGTLRDAITICDGTCSCTPRTPPQCLHTKLGLLIPAPNP